MAKTRKAKKRANGMGSVYKLTGNRAKPWGVKKNGVFIGTYTTRADAQITLEKLSNQDIKDRYNYTVDGVRELWKAEKYLELSDKGKESYDIAWALFDSVKKKKMRNVRTEDIQPLIDEQVGMGRSRSQCEKKRSL